MGLPQLISSSPPETLLLGDPEFLGDRPVADVRNADARPLARIKKNEKFPKRKVLAGGSYLARVNPTTQDRKRTPPASTSASSNTPSPTPPGPTSGRSTPS